MDKWEGRRVYHRQKGQKTMLGQKEKRRLCQLGVCLLLFLTVFALKGGERTARLGEELRTLLQTNADFGEAVIRLGQAHQSDRPIGETVAAFWMQVFSPGQQTSYTPRKSGPLFLEVESKLTEGNKLIEPQPEETIPQPKEPEESAVVEETLQPEVSQFLQPEETPSPEWVPSDYNGPELPEEASMDWYDLHLEEIVTPVSAAMTSPFGWRIDPNGEEQQFHHGLDMGVPTGTDVLAFAAGTVEYIGESDIYGQYLQIDHGNGVKSFYAHCSKLCVQQGKTVAAGEKVAESGATGNATGPHLHLELKRDGVYLNPAQYVDLLT